jgi:hypothetical protein
MSAAAWPVCRSALHVSSLGSHSRSQTVAGRTARAAQTPQQAQQVKMPNCNCVGHLQCDALPRHTPPRDITPGPAVRSHASCAHTQTAPYPRAPVCGQFIFNRNCYGLQEPITPRPHTASSRGRLLAALLAHAPRIALLGRLCRAKGPAACLRGRGHVLCHARRPGGLVLR